MCGNFSNYPDYYSNLDQDDLDFIGEHTSDNLKKLDLIGLGIESIEDEISWITTKTNLTYLRLFENNISDISALSELTNLTYLSLYNNNISDMSVLSKLENLEEFYIDSQQIEISTTDKFLEVSLPAIVSQAFSLYNAESLETYNCTVSDDYIATIDEGVETATITISGGDLTDSVITINVEDTTGPGDIHVTKSDPDETTGAVTVTITANEQMQEVEGWTLSEDGMSISKVFYENGTEDVILTDLSGNTTQVKITVKTVVEDELSIDVEYSTTVSTNGDVTVTITSNKELEEVEGWTLSSDKLSLTKTYTENYSETVILETEDGETTNVEITVTNIDKTEPEVGVSYSTTEETTGIVTVTITSNEKMQKIEGWTLSSDGLSAQKIYYANATETVTVKDTAGNETTVTVEVSNIVEEEENGSGSGSSLQSVSDDNSNGSSSSSSSNASSKSDETTATKELSKTGSMSIILLLGILAVLIIASIFFRRKKNKIF